MRLTVSQKCRVLLACGVLAAAVAGAVAATAGRDREAADADVPGLYCCEAEGFRYEYHAPTGCEGLYELRPGPDGAVDVIESHADVAARCRSALREKLRVARLEDLRAQYADTIRRLQALGYL
jgi:hypothetical protein